MRSIFIVLAIVLSTMVGWAQNGTWSGDLDIQDAKLSLVFHFDADGGTESHND